MTLIALFADDEGILLCGDGLRLEENNPTPQTDVEKVFCTPDGRICTAMYGDMPFPDGHGGERTDRWLADFTRTCIPADAPASHAAFLVQQAMRNPKLGNRHAKGGGFLVAGYEGGKAAAFEIRCWSKSQTDDSLIVGGRPVPSEDFHELPLLRGIYGDYSSLFEDVGLAFPRDRTEQIQWFDGVVKVLTNRQKPVGGQSKHIIIERPRATLGYIDAEAEINGSLGSQPVPTPPPVVPPDLS